MFKFLVVLVVVIAAAGALWYTGLLSQWVPSVPTVADLMNPKTATTTPEAPAPQQTQQQAVNDLPTDTTDASDAAIIKDEAAIDAQMTSLNTDSSNAQASTNDKAVTQEY